MKQSRLIIYAVAFWMMSLFSGCGSLNGLMSVGTDKKLPIISSIKVLVEKNSVGFEWPAINNKEVKGIHVYRATPSDVRKQKFIRLATLNGSYATHYVDKNIMPNMRYLYTFTTFDLLHESGHGKVVKVKTSNAFKSVDFVKVYLRDKGIVKILWKPHANPRITGYVIQRRLTNKEKEWHYLSSVSGRLMPEYIDASAAKGHEYSYRVVARSSNGALSQPSHEATISVK